MSASFDGNLTYRDYVVHIFTGILFNVFLVAALYTPDTVLPPAISDILQKLDATTEIILSLAAIPVLFIEGHFLLAFDRFLFVEFPTWWCKCKKNRDYAPDDQNTPAKPYYAARKRLYQNNWLFFQLLFEKRVVGQRIIKEVDEDCTLVKNQKESALSRRYYVLSDFFKGCGTSAWIALVVAVFKHNWWCVGVLGGIIVFAWLRCRFYSKLYMRKRYVKKGEEKNVAETPKNDVTQPVAATTTSTPTSTISNTPTITINANGEGVCVNNNFQSEPRPQKAGNE